MLFVSRLSTLLGEHQSSSQLMFRNHNDACIMVVNITRWASILTSTYCSMMLTRCMHEQQLSNALLFMQESPWCPYMQGQYHQLQVSYFNYFLLMKLELHACYSIKDTSSMLLNFSCHRWKYQSVENLLLTKLIINSSTNFEEITEDKNAVKVCCSCCHDCMCDCGCCQPIPTATTRWLQN